ncbi:MAG: hypothetical protein ABIL03_01395, partial [candidate division WOR-3 bacterium]
MIQLGIALLLFLIHLYYAHFKRDLRPGAIAIIFMHLFAIWGIFSIFGNIKGAIISVIVITALMGISTIVYIFQNLRLSDERLKFKREVDELYERVWEIVEGYGDPFEFIKDFDRVWILSKTLGDDEDKEKLEKILVIIQNRRDVFALE